MQEVQEGSYLLKRAQEFQSEDSEVPQDILTPHLGRNRRRFARHQAGRCWSRGRYGELDHLVHAKGMGGSNGGPASANIQRFCQLNKLDAGHVRSPQEDGDLDTNTRASPGLRSIGSSNVIHLSETRISIHSTGELVHIMQISCQSNASYSPLNPICINELI